MTTGESLINGEHHDGSIERAPQSRGAGAIFHIRDTDQFMFFLRDDKDWIPYPNMVDVIGGHLEGDESAEEGAMREFGEELEYADTGKPFQPAGLMLFRKWIDERNVEQNIFGCELPTLPKLTLKEGQSLVVLTREQLETIDFAFNYNGVVRSYAASV